MRCHVSRPRSRPAEIMATYQVHRSCQKVIEYLYIILPSYNMYLITFWHNSALGFILGWWPYEMWCQPAKISASHKSRPAKIMATYQVYSSCQKVIECLYIILPSYNMYLITFWHNSALAFILGWWPYEMSCQPAKIMATYQVHSSCQKVIEYLYIILPSYNMSVFT